MNCFLSPSMLAADFTKLGEQLKTLEEAKVPYLHLDVMDGVFVPNISFGIPVIKSIRKATKMLFDVHLMIVEPEKYVEEFYKAGADLICFHVEATKNPADVIAKIKSFGLKAAITLKPGTPLQEIEPFLEQLDMVLVMTVEPGFGGQSFMADMMPKVKTLREKYPKLNIEVDGGLAPDTVDAAAKAGANCIVAGSSVFKSKDCKATISILREAVKKYN